MAAASAAFIPRVNIISRAAAFLEGEKLVIKLGL
jgi:hypothetical protein